jgi:hypothetical protein
VKSAAVSWLSWIKPRRGYESRRSLTAYDRKFKHCLRAGTEISQLIKGFV